MEVRHRSYDILEDKALRFTRNGSLHKAATLSVQFLMVCLGICCSQPEVHAMSLFSKRVIFSEVKGVVVHEGKPVEGAEIERSFHLATGEKGADQTRTDASGRFSFKRITKSPGLLGLLPHEPVIGQNIVIKVGGKQYMAWQFVKHDYEDNGELDGKPLDLICDLATEPSRRGGVYGICRIK